MWLYHCSPFPALRASTVHSEITVTPVHTCSDLSVFVVRTFEKNMIDQKVTHNNIFLHWHCGWEVQISPRYSLKFSLQT